MKSPWPWTLGYQAHVALWRERAKVPGGEDQDHTDGGGPSIIINTMWSTVELVACVRFSRPNRADRLPRVSSWLVSLLPQDAMKTVQQGEAVLLNVAEVEQDHNWPMQNVGDEKAMHGRSNARFRSSKRAGASG